MKNVKNQEFFIIIFKNLCKSVFVLGDKFILIKVFLLTKDRNCAMLVKQDAWWVFFLCL